MGGSVGKSKSDAKQSQDVWGGQSGALQNLYGNAEQMFGNNQDMQGMAQGLGQFNQGVMDSANQGFQNMLGGGSVGDTSGIMDRLMQSIDSTAGGSQTGKMYQSIVGGEGNTYIDPMVEAMKQSGMENLDRMQAGTGLEAAAMGQGGSSRHAMQNAMQSRDMNNDMLNREMNMRGGAYDTDLNMKLDIARQADSGIQASQDRLMGLLGQSDQNVQTGLGYGQNMQALGMGSMAPMMQAQNQGWSNMGNYANTIGAPTVLGSGSQSGKSAGGSGSLKGYNMFEQIGKFLASPEGQAAARKIMDGGAKPGNHAKMGMQNHMQDMSQFANMNGLLGGMNAMGGGQQQNRQQTLPPQVSQYIQSLLSM